MHSGSPVVPSPVLLLLDADTAPVLVSSVVLELVLVVGSPVVVVPVPVAEPAVVVPVSVVVGVVVVVTDVELLLLELAAVSLALSVVVLPSSVHAASAGATSEIP